MKKLVVISLLAMGSGVAGCCGDGSGDHAGYSNALNTAGAASTGSGDRAASSNASNAAGAASTGSGDRAASSNASNAAGAASTGSGDRAASSNASDAAGAASTGSGAHAGHSSALSTVGAASIASEHEEKWIWNGQGHKELQTLRSKNGFAVLSFKLPKTTEFPNFEISLIQSGVHEYTISTTDQDSYGKLAFLNLKVAAPTDELRKILPRLQGLHVEQKDELDGIQKILKSSIEYVWTDEENQEHKSGDQVVTALLNKYAPGHEFLPYDQGGDKLYWIVTRKANSVGKYGWQITEQIEHSDARDPEVDISHDIEETYHVTKLSPSSSASSWTDAGSAVLDQHRTDGALLSEDGQTETHSEVSEKDGKTIQKIITSTTRTKTMSGVKQTMRVQSQHEAHVSTIASGANSEKSEVFPEPQSPSELPLIRKRKDKPNKNRP